MKVIHEKACVARIMSSASGDWCKTGGASRGYCEVLRSESAETPDRL